MIEQLLEFYYKYDLFQDGYLPKERAREIYQLLLDRGRLHIYTDNTGNLLGMGESLRLSFSDFGRLVCGQNLYSELEKLDIETGPIAVLMNVTILPEWRTGMVLKILRNDFFIKNYSAKYFTGHAKRKKHSPWKMFSKDKIYFHQQHYG